MSLVITSKHSAFNENLQTKSWAVFRLQYYSTLFFSATLFQKAWNILHIYKTKQMFCLFSAYFFPDGNLKVQQSELLATNWPLTMNWHLSKISRNTMCWNVIMSYSSLTPCCTTVSGKRRRSSSSISALSNVLKHCSVAFSSISHWTRPGRVSNNPKKKKERNCATCNACIIKVTDKG